LHPRRPPRQRVDRSAGIYPAPASACVPFWDSLRLASRRIAASLLFGAAFASGYAGEPSLEAPGLYEITAQTVMPHLEENLRYAVAREQRCLRLDQAESLFPVLRHPSLEGCRLDNERRSGTRVAYRLVCANVETASGSAQLEAAGGRVAGTLEVKMGGKNMTFHQRVEAVRLRDCDPPRQR
jgi:hypothetical protein